MRLIELLKRKDGVALTLAIAVGFAAVETLGGVPGYISTSIFGDVASSVTFKSAFVIPVASFLIALAAVEAWLWAVDSYLRSSRKK